MHSSATKVDPEWDTHDPSFLDQEDALLKKVGLSRDRPEDSGDDLWQGCIRILASLFRNAGTEIWRMF